MSDSIHAKYDDLRVAVSRALGRGELPTAAVIRETIDEYRKYPIYEINKEAAEKLARQLEGSLGVSMEIGSVITEKNHVEWLSAAKPSITPYYWDRYYELLEGNGFPPKVIAKLDQVTDRTLGLLGNP